MIDFNRLDTESFFSVVLSTRGMTGPHARFLRAEILEQAFAEYSDRQLTWLNGNAKGVDHLINLTREGLEMKGLYKMFLPRAQKTSSITVMNFNRKETPTSLDDLEKTFDYMVLVDTGKYSLGYCTWEAVMENAIITPSQVKTRIDHKNITFVCENLKVKDTGIDFKLEIRNFVKSKLKEIQEKVHG